MSIKKISILSTLLFGNLTFCMVELEKPVDQLFRGAKEGKLGLVKTALDARVDVDVTRKEKIEVEISCCGFTPLMKASEWGRSEVVKYLLKAKARINKRNEYGDTALRMAAGSGMIGTFEVVKILLAAKADPNIVESWTGTTALSCLRNTEMIQYLLKSKADPNIRYQDNPTFLMELYEEDSCREDLVDILLKAGADVNLQNSVGENILMHAIGRRYCNKKSIIKFLKADINLLQVDEFKKDVLWYMKNYEKNDPFIITLIERLIVQQKRQAKEAVYQHLLPVLADIVLEYACYK